MIRKGKRTLAPPRAVFVLSCFTNILPVETKGRHRRGSAPMFNKKTETFATGGPCKDSVGGLVVVVIDGRVKMAFVREPVHRRPRTKKKRQVSMFFCGRASCVEGAHTHLTSFSEMPCGARLLITKLRSRPVPSSSFESFDMKKLNTLSAQRKAPNHPKEQLIYRP